MVFLKTKHGAEKLSKHLEHIGFAAASIHGNKSQSQRERALKAFRDGTITFLWRLTLPPVASTFQPSPMSSTTTCQTCRTPTFTALAVQPALADGIAIAFCAPDEIRLLRDIEKLTKVSLTVSSGEAPADNGRGQQQPRGNRGNEGKAKRPHRGQGPRSNGNGEGREHAPRDQAARPRRPEPVQPSAFAEVAELRDDSNQSPRPARKPHRKGPGAVLRSRLKAHITAHITTVHGQTAATATSLQPAANVVAAKAVFAVAARRPAKLDLRA